MSGGNWVVFDYGEVISRRTEALPELAAVYGVPLEEFEPFYWQHRRRYDQGLPDVDYWHAVGVELGVPVDDGLAAELTELDIAGWAAVADTSLELLESLADAGSRMALLSNAPCSFARFAERQPWARHFRQLLFSGDVGIAKPDQRIFELLLSRIGAEPAECLFLDDRQENVDAARAAGLRAQRWTGPVPAEALAL